MKKSSHNCFHVGLLSTIGLDIRANMMSCVVVNVLAGAGDGKSTQQGKRKDRRSIRLPHQFLISGLILLVSDSRNIL